MWKYRGQKRPDFAIMPGAGQESVWDYPRPPKLATDGRRVEIYYGEQEIALFSKTYRVLETASPRPSWCAMFPVSGFGPSPAHIMVDGLPERLSFRLKGESVIKLW